MYYPSAADIAEQMMMIKAECSRITVELSDLSVTGTPPCIRRKFLGRLWLEDSVAG